MAELLKRVYEVVGESEGFQVREDAGDVLERGNSVEVQKKGPGFFQSRIAVEVFNLVVGEIYEVEEVVGAAKAVQRGESESACREVLAQEVPEAALQGLGYHNYKFDHFFIHS